MEISWQPLAFLRMQEIMDYISEVAGEQSALRMADKIDSTVSRLLIFPNMGMVEAGMGNNQYVYRSILAHPHYKVIYYIKKQTIHIFTIWDCRQNPVRMSDTVTSKSK